jgi:hypothetical protein
MTHRKSDIVLIAGLAGALVFGAAACQRKSTETTVATSPDAGAVTTTTTTTTITTAAAELVPAADTTVITADPVVVSQRNATRRRAASQSRSTASSSSTREGRPGYSEERSARESAPAPARDVPSGTIVRVAFDEPISTATAKVGDTVRGRLLDDLLDEGGRVAAASGSRVVGKVEHAVDSGKLARPAELRFRLTEIETKSGMTPVQTSAYDRVGKTHTKRNVEYIAGGAAVGAIVGQVLGRDTESTLKGAAAGAAVGTGVAAATGDLDFTVDAGQTVAFTLEEPIRVR